jgi:hypothetical protein
MKLKRAQRELLLSWIAEGLTSDTINERAATVDQPFVVTRQNVHQYRQRYSVRIDEINQAADFAALHEGLSKKENRVLLLHKLAQKLSKDIFENKLLWVSMVKGIGSQDNYERVEYEEFNKAEVESLRGVLDDIAREVGDRSKIEQPPVNLNLSIDGLQAVLDKAYGNTGS